MSVTTTETVVASTDGIAVGRSGQVSHRNAFAGATFGVDVMLADVNGSTPNHPKGVVTRGFAGTNALANAQKFADKLNSGNGLDAYYSARAPRNAIVVPVFDPAAIVADDYAAMVAYVTKATEAYIAKAAKA